MKPNGQQLLDLFSSASDRTIDLGAGSRMVAWSQAAFAVLGGGRGTYTNRELELLGRLTAREKEVLDLLTRALGTEEMASRLGVSRTTIRNHLQRILAKLEVHNRAGAIAIALRWSNQEPGPRY